jgi:hypothetical protein
MHRFIESGISGIFTNKPDILKAVLADIKQTQKSEGKNL